MATTSYGGAAIANALASREQEFVGVSDRARNESKVTFDATKSEVANIFITELQIKTRSAQNSKRDVRAQRID